jgi:hypothetical protein
MRTMSQSSGWDEKRIEELADKILARWRVLRERHERELLEKTQQQRIKP